MNFRCPFISTLKNESDRHSPIESKMRIPWNVLLWTPSRASSSNSPKPARSPSRSPSVFSSARASGCCCSSTNFWLWLRALSWEPTLVGRSHRDLASFAVAVRLSASNDIISLVGSRMQSSQTERIWLACRYVLITVSVNCFCVIRLTVVDAAGADEVFRESLWCLGNTMLFLLASEAHWIVRRTVSFSTRWRNSLSEKLTIDEKGPDMERAARKVLSHICELYNWIFRASSVSCWSSTSPTRYTSVCAFSSSEKRHGIVMYKSPLQVNWISSDGDKRENASRK